MLKQLVYGTIGAGVIGVSSICDLCKPQTASAAPSATVGMLSAATLGLAPAARPVAAELKTVRLAVAGMTCGGCVVGTRKVLTRLPGVTKADVSYEQQAAVVTFDPAKVTVAQMIAAIKTLGYTATVAPATTQG